MSHRTTAEPHARFPWAGALLALFVFASHLPFVTPGFGTDTDGWKFASAVREMGATGRYVASRMPGYPVMEIVSVPFARLGPWAPNTLSAIAAAVCAWLAARLFARHGVRDALLAGAAFACLPAAFIAGTSSMDYLWALAFALAAWLDASSGRSARAGLWLGLAIGTRLTSILFLPSLALLLTCAGSRGVARRVLGLGGIAALVALACYAPVFATYQWRMFTYSEITGGQSSALRFATGMLSGGDPGVAWPLIAGQATVLLAGVVGCVAVGVALLSLAWQRRGAPRAASVNRVPAWAAAVVVALEGLVYLRLPHDEGYLLPIVPFLMLALAAVATPARFRAVCVAFLLSPFLFGVDVEPPKKGLTPATASAPSWRLPVAHETVVIEPLRGPVLRDHAKRERMLQVADQLERWWPQRPARFLIATGNLTPMVYHLFPEPSEGGHYARFYPPAVREQAQRDGIPIYALPDVARRMALNEHVQSIPGLIPLAGAQDTP
ncbi:MAG TPA: hypothetical protein VN896_08540 [Methylomirabilota bacterium]|nr:hypothetical protein [Methylomirabilota bacterium]